jgi:hypothetical protein
MNNITIKQDIGAPKCHFWVSACRHATIHYNEKSTEKQALVWIPQGARGSGRSTAGKKLFLRNLENTAKQGTRLRRWWATGSDENASKKLYVSNGRKEPPPPTHPHTHHHHHHYHPCYDFLFFLLFFFMHSALLQFRFHYN